ncbi:hypothetical protein IV203_029984 [Nitzschia inconspicua]|uniref:Uncharacterized protein n=1 Tax=Nitzschia inconspicua TaxID=303405 RepID=A0A9K3LRR5_9STRA|nr:hypothetical protein IV203_029984 [Nitzschia inconspicua]
MMKRITSPTFPTAVTFFGRQTSSDHVDDARITFDQSGITTIPPCAPSRNQVTEKQTPVRSISLRKLTSNFSWNKRFSGLQKSNNIFGNKVDDANKQGVPPDDGHCNKKSHLKPPPVSAIEVEIPSSSFDDDSSSQCYPQSSSLAPEAIPMPSANRSAGFGRSLKKPPPPSPMEGAMKRIPPSTFPPDYRYSNLESRGSIHPHLAHKDVSSMRLIDRPNKPHRQYSKMPPSQINHPRQQPLRDYSHQQYHHLQQPYSQVQQCDYSHRRYQISEHQQERSRNHLYPEPQRNTSISHSNIARAENPMTQDEWQESSAFSSFTHDDMFGNQQWASKSFKLLKDPPPPPSLSSPPMSNERPAFRKSASSPVISPRKKQPVYIEIFPGNTQVLRGADETTRAMRKNFVTLCKCISCTVEHLCIADAAFVICPVCRCVSQAPDHALNEQYGVGLGFLPDGM